MDGTLNFFFTFQVQITVHQIAISLIWLGPAVIVFFFFTNQTTVLKLTILFSGAGLQTNMNNKLAITKNVYL